jgi:hypothetical protein
MSRCPVCETRVKRAAPHALKTKEYYEVLIDALTYVSYRYGYALATHGSLGFDIDLVACPWRESCASPESLAEVLRSVCESIIGIAEARNENPVKKPCGRLAWTFYLVYKPYEGPYLDLSIMPQGNNATMH